MITGIAKIDKLSDENIYRSMGTVSDFYSRYPGIKKSDVLKVISKLKHKLSYNTKTGKTKMGNEVIAEFTRKSDIQKYSNIAELIQWEFSGIILNAAQMVYNGHSIY